MSIQQFILAVACLFVGALISFFITTLSQRKMFKELAKEITLVHEKIHHKKSSDTAIKEHENTCIANNGFSSLKAGLIYLVTQNGGNPKDIGLI